MQPGLLDEQFALRQGVPEGPAGALVPRPGDPVGTAEELERRVGPLRGRFLGRRDLPFPVALTRLPAWEAAGGEPGEAEPGEAAGGNGTGEDPEPVPGVPAPDYGVTAYPTAVLIGRDGRVVGPVGIGPDAAGAIEAALAAPVVAPKPRDAR